MPRARSLLLNLCFLTLVLLGVLPAGLAAQGRIEGRVTAETGQGLSAVNVEVRDGESVVASTATGATGYYSLDSVPVGSYTVRFLLAGWRTVLEEAEVTSGETALVEATMVEGSYRLNPIVVSVSRTEEKALETPSAVEVIQTRDIDERPAPSIADHVRDEPGVDMIDTGVVGSYTVLRGFNNIFSGVALALTDNRIARLPSFRANINHLNPTTNLDIDRIEVVLGPGSALYGPDAANGVIHTITKSPIDHPGASFSVGGGLRQEDAMGGVGGDMGLFHGEGRVAFAPSEKFGLKVSGQYFSGTEFTFLDAVEAEATGRGQACIASGYAFSNPACGALAQGLDLTTPEDQALFRQAIDNVAMPRDNALERYTWDARADFRPSPETSIVLNAGAADVGRSVDLTGLGAAQAINWVTSHFQGRVTHKSLFAQIQYSANSSDETYLLRSGRQLRDRSKLIVGQIQNGTQVSDAHHVTYGLDYIRTDPDTHGTIFGQNEGALITEIGGYAQWRWTLNPTVTLLGAFRADNNSESEGMVFSPRAALLYKPSLGSNFRLVFNRAFQTPTSLTRYLDISAGTIPIGDTPFGYDVRATGSTSIGHPYMRDANGPMFVSPFSVLIGRGAREYLPTTTASLWQLGVALAGAFDPSLGALLGQLPAPSGDQVGVLARVLDPAVALGAPPPPGCAAPPFCQDVNLSTLEDVAPLRPTVSNTLELGYKGLLGDNVLLGANAWWSRTVDHVSALRVGSPNVFLDPAGVGAYLDAAFRPLVGIAFPSEAVASATAASIAELVAAIPLGAVTPTSAGGRGASLAYIYENLGNFSVWGAEVSANIVLSDLMHMSASVSGVSSNQFTTDGPRPEQIPLNAPTLKATAGLVYRNDDAGVNWNLRMRTQNGFPAASGVYVGDVEGFTTLDAGFGYRIPGFEDLWFQFDVQNALDSRYQTFPGTPFQGRMILARMRWDLSP